MKAEDQELLGTLADEARLRTARITEGIAPAHGGQPVSDGLLEELRTEAYALKGAAAVVGQARLYELARALEDALVDAIHNGGLRAGCAQAIAGASEAFVHGAEAAATGSAEPPSVVDAIDALAV